MSSVVEEQHPIREDLTEQEVTAWLRANPEFLLRHPEVLEVLVPPDKYKNDKVWDFQHFAIRRLQENVKTTRQRFDSLVSSARDNSSVQQQVMRAILAVVRARTLEQLLEAVTVDLPQLFAVDVVRLALESDAAGVYENMYPEEDYSGVVFIEPGTCDALFGKKKNTRLSADVSVDDLPGFEAIFSECTKLVKSCALLRLTLSDPGREAILAFGVREIARFHPEQGVDLLKFFALVVEERLDLCLKDMGLEEV